MNAYLKRLAVSSAIVCVATLPGCLWLGLAALGLPWVLVLLIVAPNDATPPLLLGILTVLVLVLASFYRASSVIATVWFCINVLCAWIFMALLQSAWRLPPG